MLMQERRSHEEGDVIDRLINEVILMTNVMGEGIAREVSAKEATALALYAEDDAPVADEADFE